MSLTCRQRKKGLFSSLKGLDNLAKKGRDKRPSASQVPPSVTQTLYSCLALLGFLCTYFLVSNICVSFKSTEVHDECTDALFINKQAVALMHRAVQTFLQAGFIH